MLNLFIISNVILGVFFIKLVFVIGYLVVNGYWWGFIFIFFIYLIFVFVLFLVMFFLMKLMLSKNKLLFL